MFSFETMSFGINSKKMTLASLGFVFLAGCGLASDLFIDLGRVSEDSVTLNSIQNNPEQTPASNKSILFPIHFKKSSGLSAGFTASTAEVNKLISNPKFKLVGNNFGLTTLSFLMISSEGRGAAATQQEAFILAPVTYETPKYQTKLTGWVVLSSFSNSSDLNLLKNEKFNFKSRLADFLIKNTPGSLQFEILQNNRSLVAGNAKKGQGSPNRYNFYVFSELNGKILINYFYIRGSAQIFDFPETPMDLAQGLVAPDKIDIKINKNPDWSVYFEDADFYLYRPDFITDYFHITNMM